MHLIDFLRELITSLPDLLCLWRNGLIYLMVFFAMNLPSGRFYVLVRFQRANSGSQDGNLLFETSFFWWMAYTFHSCCRVARSRSLLCLASQLSTQLGNLWTVKHPRMFTFLLVNLYMWALNWWLSSPRFYRLRSIAVKTPHKSTTEKKVYKL